MASLESVYHDFPRLARQSGFHFQLHRGEVNWSEIENVSVDEITENKNFHLLERNLINVINCNLDREYDLKILDKNFVKLFKLAQLGVDYLFYCEMYLDKCVILLQEQLIAFQEKCESLTQENQKIKKELNSIKRKSKSQNYQCEKCEKVFISDVYLKYHNKRRHSTPVMSERTNISHKKSVDNWQQTEHQEKSTTSTQTLFLDKVTTDTQNYEDRSSLKMPLIKKIENLELELQDLKERLRKAENTLSKKTEAVKSNECHSSNTSGSMQCNSMLMLLPSYVTQLSNGYYEINPRCQTSVPEACQENNSLSARSVNFELAENKLLMENFSQVNTEFKKPFEKVCESAKEKSESYVPVESIKNYQSEENNNLEYNKENIDPNKRNNSLANLMKPLPPPRKSKKKKIPPQLGKENKALEEPLGGIKNSTNQEQKAEDFNSHSKVNRSTPVKEKLDGIISEIFEESKDNLSEINKPTSNSVDSLDNKKSEPETEFFIKKIISKNSPKLRKFGKNFKSSLTNLYDSVSFTQKDMSKKESNNQNLKAAVVDKLNNHLRRLGVDPEWSGIPRKSMTQKLNVLKHSRRILSKKNPRFPDIRRNIEEKLFQRIKKNLGKKKAVSVNKLHKQKSISTSSPTTQDSPPEHKLEFIKSKNCIMYSIDTDLESKSSDSESDSNRDIEQNVLQKPIIVEDLISECERNFDAKKDEFNISVFQVGGSKSLDNMTPIGRQTYISDDKTDEVLTDSDIEYHFLENSNDVSFIKPKELLSSKRTDENTDLEKNYEDSAQQFELSHLENAKAQNSIIPKRRNISQSKLTVSEKKKVLFANYASDFEEELSDSPTDDELWTFRSEWARII